MSEREPSERALAVAKMLNLMPRSNEALALALDEFASPSAAPASPTEDELSALIKPVWKAAKPTREAQTIRSTLAIDFDDPRWKQWVSDFISDYVWDLVDIAAQRGIDRTAPAPVSQDAEARAQRLYDEHIRKGCVVAPDFVPHIAAAITAAVQAERERLLPTEPDAEIIEAMAAARYQVPIEQSHDQRTTNYWIGASNTVKQNERNGMRAAYDAIRARSAQPSVGDTE